MQETTPQTKFCNICKTEKSIDMFSKCKSKKDGIHTQCKSCDKSYRDLHKEKRAEQISEWRKLNKDKMAEQHLNWTRANKEKVYETNRKWQEANKAHMVEYKSMYSKTPKGRLSLKNSRYKRRSKLKEGDVPTLQLVELEQSAKVCYWCNKPLKGKITHIDHYEPLSKGGEHTLSNLVISCQPCNNKKHAKDPIVFAQSIGKLF